MPTHNHTGTTNSSTTGVTDSGHAHTYRNHPAVNEGVGALASAQVANETTQEQTTGTSSANIVDPGHVHTFTTNNTGGSNAHNNMQPTIFVGSLIYSGKATYGATPFSYNPNNLPIV